MTNYERICADKAFCAHVISESSYDSAMEVSVSTVIRWLDMEQVEVSDERAQEGKTDEN